MEKKTISAFEFVFMEAADPEKAKEYRPLTPKEEMDRREASLMEQASKLRIVDEQSPQ